MYPSGLTLEVNDYLGTDADSSRVSYIDLIDSVSKIFCFLNKIFDYK